MKRIVRAFYHFAVKYCRIDWLSTIRVNMKLPFRQMVRMPIWVYNCRIKTICGKIVIDSEYIKPGMIRLGLISSGMCGNYSSLFLDIRGTLIFKGPGYMGNNSAIEIEPSASVEFGKNFGITGGFKLASREKIAIGNNFSCSWEVSIFDTDFHPLIDLSSQKVLPFNGPVSIGDDVWICQRVTILKNSQIPGRCVVSSNSLVNGKLKDIPQNTVLGGIPAHVIKENVTRDDFIQFGKHPIVDITRYLHLD